jgi:DNA-binding GntR family transcriptional regulator
VPTRSRRKSVGVKANAYDELRNLLLGGDVRPGQRLSHRSLAKDLGLSRSPVREALLALEAEGLIEHRPQSGVYLREVSPRELEELYDMREIIEPYAAERAARMADTAQLEYLRRTCDEFTEIVGRRDLERWLDAPANRFRLSSLDREFHTTILTASNNRIARRFFENAQVLSLVVSWNFLNADSGTLAARAIPTAKQHRAINDAIRRREPSKAAKLMRGHIRGMKKRVIESIHRS